jgi:hypothetical protein
MLRLLDNQSRINTADVAIRNTSETRDFTAARSAPRVSSRAGKVTHTHTLTHLPYRASSYMGKDVLFAP